ncbi:MAG: hypothetical protein JWP58_1250 [Hymenobacter sp.]|nr:hypothetical protein [Hymenobacter sp.]
MLVDALWQEVLDHCISTLPAPLRADLLRAGFTHWAEPVRRLCAEYTGRFPYAGAEELLDAAVAHADPITVRRYALLAFSRAVADFVNNNPTIKMLALSFLIMIGLMLVMEAGHQHIEKGYLYFAMAFSLLVELLNIRLRRKAKTGPMHLRGSSPD